jgi:hypothetical protein
MACDNSICGFHNTFVQYRILYAEICYTEGLPICRIAFLKRKIAMLITMHHQLKNKWINKQMSALTIWLLFLLFFIQNVVMSQRAVSASSSQKQLSLLENLFN